MEKAETFLPIPGFDGYSVSDMGRILNNRTGHIRKQTLSNSGYLSIYFWNHGLPKVLTVHRLVAKIFLGHQDGMQVNHINGIRTDNRLTNLEWVTGSENMKHACKLGLVGFKIDPSTGKLAGSIRSENPPRRRRHEREGEAA